ncbi:MAG TPA: CBS domain-containing protein [Dongiaceae bacterium]|nr:CBS domain-containing protein [Dongiaceae bacterium]
MRVTQILLQKQARVVSVRPREPVSAALKLMASENIGALVVTDIVPTEGTTVLGMFSERDVVRALAAGGTDIMRLPVERLMSKKLISCSPNDDLADVMAKMDQHGIRHIPVLDEHTLVGVVGIRDVIHVLRGFVSGSDTMVPAA